MNLGEAKKKAIKLIAEWSNNGNLISDTSNADYLLRMPDLADAAQKEIAAVKKIDAAYEFSQTADRTKSSMKYELPGDFFELKKVIREGGVEPFGRRIRYGNVMNYKWEGRNTLVLDPALSGDFRVEYYRYPMTITTETTDDYVFEVDLEAQEAIPYYLAAHVSMDEPQKQNMVSTYLNMYQSKLANLSMQSNGNNQVSNMMGW